MSFIPKTFSEMVSDALDYLVKNTDITMIGEGSIARALVDATSLEMARLQDFVRTNYQNSFLSSAQGVFLDLFGETLGLPRIQARPAFVSAEDKIIRVYVRTGTLGSRLPHPSDPTKGQIARNNTIATSDGSVVFTIEEAITFPINAKTVYITAVADKVGRSTNVGIGQLTVNSLGHADVLSSNDVGINTGLDLEPDNEYRFRLSKAVSTRFGSNATSVRVAASVQPGVATVELVPFARGAGTFDVLLIPQGNRVSQSLKDATRRSVEAVTAYGISPRIREPNYVPFRITVQLRYTTSSNPGDRAVAASQAESAMLAYLASIPLGGELIINQLRSSILDADASILDAHILELCIDGKPRALRNYVLNKDEIFVPDTNEGNPVEVV